MLNIQDVWHFLLYYRAIQLRVIYEGNTWEILCFYSDGILYVFVYLFIFIYFLSAKLELGLAGTSLDSHGKAKIFGTFRVFYCHVIIIILIPRVSFLRQSYQRAGVGDCLRQQLGTRLAWTLTAGQPTLQNSTSKGLSTTVSRNQPRSRREGDISGKRNVFYWLCSVCKLSKLKEPKSIIKLGALLFCPY